MIADILKEINDVIWGRRLTDQGVAGRILATLLRYLYAMVRDFFSGQLTMRAMSLVYTTLLSVVPLLAFSFAILKGFGIFNQLEPYLTNLLAPLGEQGTEITNQVLTLVDNVRGSVLGGVGLAVFLYTAISMVQKVEESFNYTWYVSKPRNFSRRFTEYLIVLLVGPMLMVTAIGMLTSIQSATVIQWILTNEALGPLFVLRRQTRPLFTHLGRIHVSLRIHAEHQGQTEIRTGWRHRRRFHVGDGRRDLYDIHPVRIAHAADLCGFRRRVDDPDLAVSELADSADRRASSRSITSARHSCVPAARNHGCPTRCASALR